MAPYSRNLPVVLSKLSTDSYPERRRYVGRRKGLAGAEVQSIGGE